MTAEELFAKRVHEEIGDSCNPAYIASLLEKNTPDLLCQMGQSMRDTEAPLSETTHYCSDSTEGEGAKRLQLLGLQILESRLKVMLFLLKEARARIEAVTVSNTA